MVCGLRVCEWCSVTKERGSRTSDCSSFMFVQASVVKTYNGSYSYCGLRLIDARFGDGESECGR